MPFRFLSIALFFASTIGACGGGQAGVPPGGDGSTSGSEDGGSSSSPAADAATAQMSPVCTAYCGWKSRCGRTTRNCGVSCEADTARLGPNVRQAYWDAAERCFTSLACGESDDACIANFALVEPAYPNIPIVQNCLTKRTECGASFADDYCQSLAALTDEARQAADACRSRSCNDVVPCLRAAGAFAF